MVEDTLFTGFPTFKFAVSGMPLYDPSKDTTVGGSGSQRYADSTTWGGDGDSFPVVQAYNVMMGIRYAGAWLYGLQTMRQARVPAANWIAQIAKCRATITGVDGSEATYRSGGQVNVNAPVANAIEAMLTTCQGRVSEIGGFYKIHVGAPDSTTFYFTDDDILSSEPQTFKPFFSLANSVNGIQATYPDPAQAWATATAPAYYRTDLEILDGNRRLMANPAFDFVPLTPTDYVWFSCAGPTGSVVEFEVPDRFQSLGRHGARRIVALLLDEAVGWAAWRRPPRYGPPAGELSAAAEAGRASPGGWCNGADTPLACLCDGLRRESRRWVTSGGRDRHADDDRNPGRRRRRIESLGRGLAQFGSAHGSGP